MIDIMTRAGVDPAFMYVANRTGLIVTEMNQHLLSEDDLTEWNEAIDEYHDLEGRLEDVGKAGSEMPAPPIPEAPRWCARNDLQQRARGLQVPEWIERGRPPTRSAKFGPIVFS